EDGIRDFHVTGVQTCALPIYLMRGRVVTRPAKKAAGGRLSSSASIAVAGLPHAVGDAPLGQVVRRHFHLDLVPGKDADVVLAHRSEERRVGKGCSGGWLRAYG